MSKKDSEILVGPDTLWASKPSSDIIRDIRRVFTRYRVQDHRQWVAGDVRKQLAEYKRRERRAARLKACTHEQA